MNVLEDAGFLAALQGLHCVDMLSWCSEVTQIPDIPIVEAQAASEDDEHKSWHFLRGHVEVLKFEEGAEYTRWILVSREVHCSVLYTFPDALISFQGSRLTVSCTYRSARSTQAETRMRTFERPRHANRSTADFPFILEDSAVGFWTIRNVVERSSGEVHASDTVRTWVGRVGPHSRT